jgi:hypothetical protein
VASVLRGAIFRLGWGYLVGKIFIQIPIVVFLFVFDNCCLTINQLDLKDSSRKLQTNYTQLIIFYLYLMLYIYVVRFEALLLPKNVVGLARTSALLFD